MYAQHHPGQAPSVTGGGPLSALRHLDAFPKQREDAAEFFHSTVAGGVITLVASAIMALLFFSELREFDRMGGAGERRGGGGGLGPCQPPIPCVAGCLHAERSPTCCDMLWQRGSPGAARSWSVPVLGDVDGGASVQ